MKNIEYPETGERARLLGLDFYFTNKQCKRKHSSLRYASSGNCVQCVEEKRGIVFNKKRGKSFKVNDLNHSLAIEAHKSGKTTYISISPCKLGHLERYTTNGNCVECSNESNKKRQHSAKWKRIYKIYSLTENDFNFLLKKQSGKCAICLNEMSAKSIHIDHCHTTQKVRGLLCNKCNQGIGLFHENLENLKRAAEYIKNA